MVKLGGKQATIGLHLICPMISTFNYPLSDMKLLPAFNLSLNPTSPDVVSFVGGGGKTTSLWRLAREITTTGYRVVLTTTTHIGLDLEEQSAASIEVGHGAIPFGQLAEQLDQYGECLLAGPTVPSQHGLRRSGLTPEQVDSITERAADLKIAAILLEADGGRKLPIKAPADYEPPLPQTTSLIVPVVGLNAVGLPIDEEYVHRPERIRQILELPDKMIDEVRVSPKQVARLLTHPNGGAKGLTNHRRLLPLLNKADTSDRRAIARLISHHIAERGHASLIAALGSTLTDPPPNPIHERWGSVTVAILAAGRSSRMGRAKQLEATDGVPMVVRAVRTALASPAQRILVVTGAYADQVQELLQPIQAQSGRRLTFVHNSQWETGQASSVRIGTEALETETNAVIFMPVDQLFLSSVLLRKILRKWQRGARLVVPTLYGQPRGAPALFDRSLWPELMTLTGDQGARPLLQKYQEEMVTVYADKEQLFDVDTEDDLDQARG